MKNQTQDSYELILKQTSQKKKSAYSLKKTYPAYIILVIFLIASFFIRYFSAQSIQSSLINEFDKATNSVMNRLSAHYFKQIEVLNSMNGLYDTLVEVVKDYFELYATIPTKSYPSIMSVAYIPEVEHSGLDMFLINSRNLGYFYYELKTDGQHDFYYPFVNIVPEGSNYNKLGFDLGTDPVAMKALFRARDNNKMSVSDAYTVRNPDTTGIYIFYPIYMKESPRGNVDERRENFRGVLSLEINTTKFVKEAISGEGMSQRISIPSDSSVIFEVIGIDDNKKEYTIFKSDNYNMMDNHQPLLSSDQKLPIADRDFIVRFYSIPNYGGKFQQILPDISLIISIILSFALFGFVLNQITNKARAQEIADKMTRSQRRIVDTSNDIIAVLDGELVWRSMNPASLSIFGLLPENMIGNKFADLLENSSDATSIKNAFSISKDDHVDRNDFRMIKSDKTAIWVSWSFTFSVTDGLIYCIGRDVTLEKAAEEEAKLRTKQIEAANILSKEANFSKSYFMKEMSHQLRNSLTGIEGSLQMLQNKYYDNEEELDMYLDLATTSSEELFTYVTDIEDASKASDIDTSKFQLDTLNLGKKLNKCIEICKNDDVIDKNSDINISDTIADASVIADNDSLDILLRDVFVVMGKGEIKVNYEINVEVNPYEGAVELQILSSGNELVHNMINIYAANSENIVDAMKYDKDDILISITRMASTMRLLRGSFKVDSFGPKEGNLISIIFKAHRASI